MTPEQPERQSQTRGWTRVLAPLAWWLLLVLVLYGIRTHQRLMQQTFLRLSVNLEHRSVSGVSISVDGREATEGEHLSLGTHEFKVTHAKAVPYVTNRFVWYRGGELGQIELKRASGVLAITLDPPARTTVVDGPEFHKTLTDAAGLTNTVPTDDYEVKATYAHFEKIYHMKVSLDETNRFVVAPKFGSLSLACTKNDATFQLYNSNGELVENGDFPATVEGLPEGKYQLVALHHGRRWIERPDVAYRTTNDVKVDIQYGSAVFETSPAGATVYSNGREIGTTPLTLSELQPGALDYDIRLYNYEAISGSLQIKSNEASSVRTNLVSQTYTGAMRAARNYLQDGKIDSALESVTAALRAEPNDPAAKKLEQEITALANIRAAKEAAQQGNYIGGARLLKTALQILPDNDDAKRLLADYKTHEAEQIVRERSELLSRGTNAFNKVLTHQPDGQLFETHEIRTTKPYNDVEQDLLKALKSPPEFIVYRHGSPSPGTFEISAAQVFHTVIGTPSGRRNCIIVGAKIANDETQILFKVLEYKTEAVNKFSIGAAIGAPAEVKYIPIDTANINTLTEKIQARVAEGISNVTARIQGAATPSK